MRNTQPIYSQKRKKLKTNNMHYKINGLPISKKVKTITYQRKPTKAEIKFGYGAIHYRDFDLKECFDENGNLRKHIIASNDGLMYHHF